MTDEQTTDETAVEHVDEPQADEQHGDDTELAKVRREAAERRVQLREAEAERDKLRDSYRALAIRYAGAEFLADPSVLPWDDAFLDDDENPDEEKISEASKAYAAQHPHAARVRGDVGQGHRGEAASSVDLAAMLRASA